MAKTKTKYSVLEAAVAIGKHRNTITRHMKSGKLSCSTDGNLKWIEAVELHRVYGDAFDPNREEGSSPAAGKSASNNKEVVALRKMLDDEIANSKRKDAERISFLEGSLETALENENKTIFMLEDRSQEKEEVIQKLRKRTLNQKQLLSEIRENHRKKIEELKTALNEEQEKSLLQRIFGGRRS